MLDADLKQELGALMSRVSLPIEIAAQLDDSAASGEMRALIADIAALSDKITVVERDDGARAPSFAINRVASDIGVRFPPIPLGHEFTSLVLALLQVGGHPAKLDAEIVEQIRALDGDYKFEVFMSLSCHNCPDVVQALNTMAVINPRIKVVTIDGALFKAEVEARQIMAVPSVILNGEVFAQGRMGVEEILAKLDTGSATRDAAKLNALEPYEVLIVGGGPAGAAAAVVGGGGGVAALRRGWRGG